jgi:type II secretory pathway pseudopilin PulG
MIEVLVTIAVAGILFTFAVGGWRAYERTQAHRGTAEGIVALLRDTHQRAVTEGKTYCVTFSATSWQLRPSDCASTPTGDFQPDGASVTLSGVTQIVFTPRGSASPDTFVLDVIRSGSTKTYTVSVEGLTGRVEVTL